MSWPDDGEPRFVVTSVTGPSGRKSIAVNFQVVDRAYCWALVRTFSAKDGTPGGGHRTVLARRRLAETLAASLNAQDVAQDVAA